MKYSRLLFVGGGMLASVFAAFSAKKSDKPNIVFILCDDMGYGDLGCYGQKYIETPNIDRMASEGMRFTQAYSGSPVSAPSRACIMTGQHTGHGEVRGNKEYWRDSGEVRYGVNTDYAIVGQHPYDPNRVILPEIMKENGYTTGMFGKWAGGYEGSVSTPDKRGIDEFFGYICQFQAHLYYPNFLNRYSSLLGDTATIRVTLEENIKYPMWGAGYALRPQYSADLIHEAAIDWLDRQSGDKLFFGFFTYTLPHAELVQPEDSLLNYYRERLGETGVFNGSYGGRYNPVTHTHAQFAAMIARLDNYVGEILKKLKEKGLDENTIVIFSSDNGPHEEGVGYRYFTTADKAVSYPFGYGLSYTEFLYSEPSVKKEKGRWVAKIKVTNVGAAEGHESVQVYVGAENRASENPLRELKAFGKTKLLKPGESEILTMNFTDYDLAHFDEPSSSWVLEKGLYKVSFGASCEDIRSVRDIKVKKQQRWGVNRVLNPVVPVQTMTID